MSGRSRALVLMLGPGRQRPRSPSAQTRAQRHPRVVLVTNNCSENNFLCPPFEAALRSTGVSGKIISPDEREDPVATLSLLATQGYDLIVVDIFWSDILAEVAPRFPKAHFAIIDVALSLVRGRPKNVQAVVLRTNEARLPGGLARRRDGEAPRRAATSSAVVGGVSFQAVDDFIVGFTAGVLRASPHARIVLTDYSGDFTDPSKCEAIARSQIARGAGVVFNVAGACGLGTLRAAKRAGVWGVGVDTDQSGLGPHILTSVVKRYDGVMRTLLEQVRDGQMPGGVTTALMLGDRGATLGRISPKVPALRCAPRLDALVPPDRRGRVARPGSCPALAAGRVVLDGDPHQPVRHGDVLGRTAHRNARQHVSGRSDRGATSVRLCHEATHTAAEPTAIPLVPVPAFAVLSAAPVTGSSFQTCPLSPAPDPHRRTVTGDRRDERARVELRRLLRRARLHALRAVSEGRRPDCPVPGRHLQSGRAAEVDPARAPARFAGRC